MFEIPTTEEALRLEVTRLRHELEAESGRLSLMTDARAILLQLLATEVDKTAEAASRAVALKVLLDASNARRREFHRYRTRSILRLWSNGYITSEEYFRLLDIEDEAEDAGR